MKIEHGKEAGYSTETLSSSKWYHLPLKGQKVTLGVLSIAPNLILIKNKNI